MNKTALFAALLGMTSIAGTAQADKLDDIISSGTLRCAVVLDFPPMGMRDANNVPIGVDVDYCNDLAAAHGMIERYFDTKSRRVQAVQTLLKQAQAGAVAVQLPTMSDSLGALRSLKKE